MVKANGRSAGRERILGALLEHRGVEHIMNAGSESLRNPLVMQDIAGRFTGLSRTREFGDTFWDQFFTSAPPDVILTETERSGIYARVLGGDEPVTGHFSYYPNDILGRRIKSRSGVVAQVAILQENPLKKGDGELLALIADAIGTEIAYQGNDTGQSGVTMLVNELAEGSIDELEAKARLEMLHVQWPKLARSVVVLVPEGVSDIVVNLARAEVERAPKCILSIQMGDTAAFVFDCADDSWNAGSYVRGRFKGTDAKVGVGPAFTEVVQMAKAFAKAQAAVTLDSVFGSDSDVAFFDDLRPYYALWAARKECEHLDELCDRHIATIRDYDEINDAQLVPTLEAFLNHKRSMGRTARALYTHRNTIKYRIDRIENLTGMDLNDGPTCFELELSFKLLRLERALRESSQPLGNQFAQSLL